jgi:tetratricopeptide (TPR) repeat protein
MHYRLIIRLSLFLIAACNACLGQNSDSVTVDELTALQHNNRGVELGVSGHWLEAIEAAEKAHCQEPSSETFRTNLSHAYLRYGNFLKQSGAFCTAIAQYRRALFIDSKNTVAKDELNHCYSKTGRDPSKLACHIEAAHAAEAVNDFKQAAAEYQICADIDDSGYNNFKLGQCLLKAGERHTGYCFLEYALMRPWLTSEAEAKTECEELFEQK